jgi:uncharacterized iron-regulated protein
MSAARALAAGLAALLLAACAAPPAPPPPPRAAAPELAAALARQPIVLLGEVHDNAALHALRLQALRRLLEGGARPALAFEQLDSDRQAALDAARAALDAHQDLAARADRLIAAAGAKGWNWDLYRPYLELALQFELPIVAANLSRPQAMRVAQQGLDAVYDAAQRRALGLDALAADLEPAQRHEIEAGHCGRIPPEAIGPMAQAQLARDATLAVSIAPYAGRGVVLLTGNGHARRDIGVARHLSATDRGRSISIGLLEDDEQAARLAASFDVAFLVAAQPRPDPCLQLRMPAR